VVTEYNTPRPPPKNSPARALIPIGLRNPAACSRISGSRPMNAASLSQAGARGAPASPEGHAGRQADDHRDIRRQHVGRSPVTRRVGVPGPPRPHERRIEHSIRVEQQRHRTVIEENRNECAVDGPAPSVIRNQGDCAEVTSIGVRRVVEVIPQTKTRPRWVAGPGSGSEARRLASPQVVTGCAEMSVQPWGWRSRQHIGQQIGASCACERAT